MERHEFSDLTKLKTFNMANGRCQKCTRKVGAGTKLKAEYDHIQACVFEGDNSLENCRLLCSWCHKQKTKQDVQDNASVKRIAKEHAGIKKNKKKWASRPFSQEYKPRVRDINEDMRGYHND